MKTKILVRAILFVSIWLAAPAQAVPVKLKLSFLSSEQYKLKVKLPGPTTREFTGTGTGNNVIEVTCNMEPGRPYEFRQWSYNGAMYTPTCGWVTLDISSSEGGCWSFNAGTVQSSSDPECEERWGVVVREVSLTASGAGALRFKRISDWLPGKPPSATAFEEYDYLPADGKSKAKALKADNTELTGATWSFEGPSLGCRFLGGGVVQAGTESGTVSVKAVVTGCTYRGSIILGGGCGSSGPPGCEGSCPNPLPYQPPAPPLSRPAPPAAPVSLLNNFYGRWTRMEYSPDGSPIRMIVVYSVEPLLMQVFEVSPNMDGTFPAPTDTTHTLDHSSGTIVKDSADKVTQVTSDTRVINLARTSSTITVAEYDTSQITAWDFGVATVSGSAVKTTTYSRANSNNDFVITVTEGSDVKTETIRAVTGGIESTLNDNATKVRSTMTTVSSTVKEKTTEIRNNTTTVSKTVETITSYDFGWRVTQRVEGFNSVTQTTTYEYYTDSNNSNNFGELKKVVNPDGSWVIYEYTAHNTSKEYRGFGNQSPASDGSVNYTTEYIYTPVDSNDNGTVNPHMPRKIIEKLKNETIRLTLYSYTANQVIKQECTSATGYWNASGNLITKEATYSSGHFKDARKTVLHPDGTLTVYEYAYNNTDPYAATEITTTVWHGKPNGTFDAILKGTKTVTVARIAGQVLSEATYYYDGTNTLVTGSQNTTYTDEDFRSYFVTYLDGSSNTVSSACCGIDYTQDRNGVETTYLYDDLKRQIGTVRNDMIRTNILDAAGRVLVQKRSAGGTTEILQQYSYYPDGRVQYQTNALSGVTSFSESVNGSGQTEKTTTYPDGGTRVETHNKDGTLAKVTGTAVQPVRYEYDIGSDPSSNTRQYTKEIKLDATGADTSEWTKTYRDLLDREYLVVYKIASTSSESAMPQRQTFYNSKGQMSKQAAPGGVITLFDYSDTGEMVYTVTDMDQDSTIDFAGTDRIMATVSDVVSAHSTNVFRMRTWVWDADSQNVSNLLSLVETSVDGRLTWSTVVTNGTSGSGGPVSLRGISTLANNAYRITNTAPDGTYSVEAYATGRLASVTRYNSSGTQVMKTTRTYDAQERLWKINDARNGDTIYSYNAADLPITVTTPTPGSGLNAQTATTYHDSSLRAWKVTHADGTSMTNEFHYSGALKKTSGSRTYPVEYTYDPQGRMKTMKTWQNFAGNSGTATTTWNYDERGLLQNKRYADNIGPDYTYTTAGQVYEREWARGTPRVKATYSYNNAGDLWKTLYNDGVTPGVTNLYDRRGRLSSVAFNGTTTAYGFHFGGGMMSESNSGGILDGISVTTAYDSYLRRSSVIVAGYAATLNSYTYDTAGRLWTVSDGTNSATYTYLANSPLVSQIAFKENTSTRMTTVKKYDFLNRLTSIVSTPSAANTPPIAFDYQYNDANQRIRMTTEDGSYWIYDYDKLGQVTSGKRYWADGTPVAGQQYVYAFDDIGNRTTTKEGGDETGAPSGLRTSTYALKSNALNQYDTRTVPAAVEVIGAAKTGASVTVDGISPYRKGPYFEKAKSIDNSAAAQFPSIAVQASVSGSTDTTSGRVFLPKTPESFSYDLDGNLTQDGRWTYIWDGENRLIEMVCLTNIPTESKMWLKFTYDSQGRRIQKTVALYTNSAWSLVLSNRFAYDGWDAMAELNATNLVLIQGYLWGMDVTGAVGGVGGLVGIKDSAEEGHFVSFDGNGNTVALVKTSSGARTAWYENGPFFEPIRSSGSLSTRAFWRCSGKLQDLESGLLYFGFRYYSSTLGRWINPDPISEFGGVNVIAFGPNSPMNGIDSLGLSFAYSSEGRWFRDPIQNSTAIARESGSRSSPNAFFYQFARPGPFVNGFCNSRRSDSGSSSFVSGSMTYTGSEPARISVTCAFKFKGTIGQRGPHGSENRGLSFKGHLLDRNYNKVWHSTIKGSMLYVFAPLSESTSASYCLAPGESVELYRLSPDIAFSLWNDAWRRMPDSYFVEDMDVTCSAKIITRGCCP